MPLHDELEVYIRQVLSQIRWKKMHPRISQELADHMIDGKEFYLEQGLDEQAAIKKAIAQTGDATVIGTQLDRIHRPVPQWGMLAVVLALLAIGFFIQHTLNGGSEGARLMDRLVYTIIGIAAMMIAYFSDFTIVGKYPKIVCLTFTIALVFTLLFSRGFNGRPYYATYLVLLQPLLLAAVIYAMKNKGLAGILASELILLALGLISLYIPTMSGFLLVTAAGFVLISTAVYKEWFAVRRIPGFAVVFVSSAAYLAFLLLNMSAYHWQRVQIAVNPSLDARGAGYFGVLTRELLSSSKLFGMSHLFSSYVSSFPEMAGFFNKELMLTELIVVQGWGAFIGVTSVLLVFIIAGFMRCFKQKSSLGFFVAMAIMLTFSLETVSYLFYNLGLQIAEPIALPLISPGKTATIINLFLIGFMLSVFRTGDALADEPFRHAANNHRILTWDDGKLIINFKPLKKDMHKSFDSYLN